MFLPEELLEMFENNGLPRYGYAIYLDNLPSDMVLRTLTVRFKIEFAVVFTIGKLGYFLYIGDNNSVSLPVDEKEILIKHTHPNGTVFPSIYDIQWLESVQDSGSPQIQSVILPIGHQRITFNINTPYLG
ncbi:hypothetical protein [Mucilaginibacter boryungensis]|uniref:Immunity protein 50 of polymorphic toxin system n=1 Tax=Mucilaginibacter boryungensis TaxID=768480 RepID=A0ABR9XMX4_9SPHI|nr:hypothetical protein [Mucilaginibacter boryungensis]MBE9668729.1 hypothetical protein [Mucilaginibacter boryungensis]